MSFNQESVEIFLSKFIDFLHFIAVYDEFLIIKSSTYKIEIFLKLQGLTESFENNRVDSFKIFRNTSYWQVMFFWILVGRLSLVSSFKCKGFKFCMCPGAFLSFFEIDSSTSCSFYFLFFLIDGFFFFRCKRYSLLNSLILLSCELVSIIYRFSCLCLN